MLILLAALSGCLAPPIRPPAAETVDMRTVLVIPVEPPPLEVSPDLIESRLPIYRQHDTVPFDLFLERKIYRNPGGVMIAGLVAHDDIVPEMVTRRAPMTTSSIPGLQSAKALGENWVPTFALAREAVSQLMSGGLEAVASGHYYPLPLAPNERTANLAFWRGAIRDWYNQDTSPVDYRLHGPGRIDAVLEVGIGTYRIFEAQAPLQVLVKLIDPVSRKVIGRTAAEAFPVEGTAPELLAREAEKFKQLVSTVGAKLIEQSLSDLGLPVTRSVRQDERSTETAVADGISTL